jgi:gluconokinase
MSQGILLDDEDYWDWLIIVRDAAMQQLDNGSHSVIVDCSALKKRYREVIRIANYNSPDILIRFIFLHTPEHLLLERAHTHKGHIMSPNMVQKELEILEYPTIEETDVLIIDASETITYVKNIVIAMVEDKIKTDNDSSCSESLKEAQQSTLSGRERL